MRPTSAGGSTAPEKEKADFVLSGPKYEQGDTVISIRRRMQRERQEILTLAAEASHPWAASSAPSSLKGLASASAPNTEAWPPSAEEAGLGPGHEEEPALDGWLGSGGKAPAKFKVERFHRNRIRREVWRQKFDFLFRKMQEEVDSEVIRSKAKAAMRGPLASGSAAKGGGDEGDLADGGVTGEGAEGDGEAVKEETLTAAERRNLESRMRADTLMGELRKGPASDARGKKGRKKGLAAAPGPAEQSEGLQGSHLAEVKLTPKLAMAGWRRSESTQSLVAPGARRHAAPKGLSSMASSLGFSHAGSQSTAFGGGVPKFLKASTSLPMLLPAPDLFDVRDHHYDGDDLWLHEDVLHASNPKLFPLRPGRGKAFDLASISIADYFNVPKRGDANGVSMW